MVKGWVVNSTGTTTAKLENYILARTLLTQYRISYPYIKNIIQPSRLTEPLMIMGAWIERIQELESEYLSGSGCMKCLGLSKKGHPGCGGG